MDWCRVREQVWMLGVVIFRWARDRSKGELTELIFFKSGFRSRIKDRTREQGLGKGIMVNTECIAKIGMETNYVVLPVDGRVMSPKPVHPEDDWVLAEFCHLQDNLFMVMSGNGQANRSFVEDRTSGTGSTITHGEINRFRQVSHGDVVVFEEGSIDE